MTRLSLRREVGVAALACLTAAPATALASASAAANHNVTLHNIGFSPRVLSVHRGDTVTFLFRDGKIAHNVTGRGFASHTQASGSYTVRFSRTGTYPYRCTLHPGMSGTIIVH